MRIVVVGGSAVGLAAAVALADGGHEVEVLERTADAMPDTVDEAARWVRPTVPQGLHSHAFPALGCKLLRERAPDVHRALLGNGAGEVDLTDFVPPTLTGFGRRQEDADLRMLTLRRSTFELVLRQQALSRPGVTLTPGVTVQGLTAAPRDRCRVTGVRLAGGGARTADVVVDATGQRTAIGAHLADIGLPSPRFDREPCRIAYYTRQYRLLTDHPPGPLLRGFGTGGVWDGYIAMLFLGDNGTFSISIGVLPEDTTLKRLRDPAAFTVACRGVPLLAPWLDPESSEPISPVYAMGSLQNTLQSPAPGSAPPTGLFAVGDAACTTNPAYGRGISLGLAHAYLLADLLAEVPHVGERQAREFAHRTEALLRPWFDDSRANDRGRAALWEAVIRGDRPPQPPAGTVTLGAAMAAATRDSEVWRRVTDVQMLLRPPASLHHDEEMRERIRRALGDDPPPRLPGVTHRQLVDRVGAPTLLEQA